MIWTGFLLGILGSFHCVGMCGAIALSLPVGKGSGWSFVVSRFLYNLGRMVTYSLLGAGAGLLGKSLQLAGLQQTLSILSGVLILLLVVVPATASAKFRKATGLEAVLTQVKKTMGLFFQKKGVWALGGVGLLNGLLPCGFVYFALAGAVSMPTVPQAMGYMLLFGAGTFPLMFLLSLSGKYLQLGVRRFFTRAIPYAATCLAILFILRGLNLGIPYVSPATDTTHMAHSAMSSCH
ncbi:sulfite exporter TauE/SafE family protein [Rufibacter immobilis]|uniref:Sulfite exporter TauE/SafE family protein n=1 Tax=Rufibacter immobilis TaxID=1348778 RepID=A0A3M9MRR7_9BACT|nr:sulfite exporter TauE/SafE family protein [Rufibacter immobilis]RNI28206.1 sulfite exporter TauE/SafE family protein [Rufibacter immobilis]